jgi:site-specific recombinase XerD
LETVHRWKPEKARDAVHIYGLRKLQSRSSLEKRNQGGGNKPCPMDKCLRRITQVSSHLLNFHHLDAKSALYKTLLEVGRKRRRAHPYGEVRSSPESSDSDMFTDDLVDTNCDVSGLIEGMGDVDDLSRNYVPQANGTNGCVEDNRRQLPTDFLGFATWLKSIDGGQIVAADQHAAQVSVIFDVVDETKTKIDALWSVEQLKKFTLHYANKKAFQTATMKSYLNSLRHWYEYMLSEEADRLSEEQQQQIQRMKDRLNKWKLSYRKASAVRHHEKMEEDMRKLITPQMVKDFENSKWSMEVVKSLGAFSSGTLKNSDTNKVTDYTSIRNFILTHIVINNACRSGVLAEMTVTQFNNALQVDDNMVVSVVKHKTVGAHGSASVVLNSALFGWLGIFIKFVRIHIQDVTKSDCVFLSRTGHTMESGDITKAIQAAWMKAGLGDLITATLMRKSAVTSVHQLRPQDRANLADLMCHSLDTANRSYRCVEKKQTSVAASLALTQLMKSVDAAEQPAASTSMETAPGENNVAEDSDDSIVGPSQSSTTSSRHFDLEEAAVIKAACADIIKHGTIGIRQISEALQKSVKGTRLLTKYTAFQLINRVKYERKIFLATGIKFVVSKPKQV